MQKKGEKSERSKEKRVRITFGVDCLLWLFSLANELSCVTAFSRTIDVFFTSPPTSPASVPTSPHVRPRSPASPTHRELKKVAGGLT